MALAQATLTKALAPTFKSPDFTSENDPEPGLAAELPSRDDSVSVEQHQSLCADNWESAINTWLAEMDPPHIVAIGGDAGDALRTALLSAFKTWYANGVWDCDPLNAAFVSMADKVFKEGKELHTDLEEGDWEWTLNIAPPGTPELCKLPSIDENSSTPYTTAADEIAAKIHKWFIKGKTTYTKIKAPELGSTITYDWGGSEA